MFCRLSQPEKLAVTLSAIARIVALSLLVVPVAYGRGGPTNKDFVLAKDNRSEGLVPTRCWFGSLSNWDTYACYYMQVPEDRSKPGGRHIRFPVLMLESQGNASAPSSPVLHTGGGGPGGPMYLDSQEAADALVEYHRKMTLDIGRDFYVMDPRGSGLSDPLLSCTDFVDNLPGRLATEQTWRQEEEAIDSDFKACIARFKRQGIDFNQYNSLAVAQDIRSLSRATRNESLALLGISYGTIYAQLAAELYPGLVESMVLDSPTFLGIKPHQFFEVALMMPWNVLDSYCDYMEACDETDSNVSASVLSLYQDLEDSPIRLSVNNGAGNEGVSVLLDGDLFVAAVMEGLYSADFFGDIPGILEEIPAGETASLRPYLESHIAYLFEKSWGDVADSAHLCFEVIPYTDYAKIRNQIAQLPEGYIRESAAFWLDTDNYCDEMEVDSGPPFVASTGGSDIPVLFLQGELDSVTPAELTNTQLSKFSNSLVLYFPEVSHGVVGQSACAEILSAKFLETRSTEFSDYEPLCE